MPIDPRPPLGGFSAAPVLPPPAAPAPAAASAAVASAGAVASGAASDFASVMAQLRSDLAAGATLPGAPPLPEPPLDSPAAAAGGPLAAPSTSADAAAVDMAAPGLAAPAVAAAADADPAGEATDGAVAPADWRGMDARDRTRAMVEGRQVRTTENGDDWLFGEDGFGFDDLIDVVNPLQHIPIISSIYRWITGDEIAPAAQMAGGALFGGPLGFAGAVANVAFEEVTGHDVAGTAIALVLGEDDPVPASATNLAALPSDGFTRGREGVRSQGGSPAPADVIVPAAEEEQLAEAVAPEIRDVDPGAGGADLRDGAAAAVDIPAGFVLAAEGRSGIGAIPSAAPAPADGGDPGIAAQMMLALDKYQALARERGLGSAPPPPTPAGSLYDGRL